MAARADDLRAGYCWFISADGERPAESCVKSMTITINYITYRIAKDPNINVLIVSKTQEQAKKFLYAIKQRLTHPKYADLQVAFGPADGYRATADQWAANRIYLGGMPGTPARRIRPLRLSGWAVRSMVRVRR